MKREIQSVQRLETRYLFEIDENGGSPILVTGGDHATLTVNGVGDYTLTLNEPGSRILQALTTAYAADAIVSIGTRTIAAVDIAITAADGSTAADEDCAVEVIKWDSADET